MGTLSGMHEDDQSDILRLKCTRVGANNDY
jgi:hypothetical protein